MPAGQKLGIWEVDDGIWLVSFMHYDLGYIDLEQRTLQTIYNPFGTRLSPMSWVRSVAHVSGSAAFCARSQVEMWAPSIGEKLEMSAKP